MHQENTSTKIQAVRTTRDMFLGPSGNLQGGYTCFDLSTGCKITCRIWTSLPISLAVIDLVNQIGLSEGKLYLLTFYDHKVNPVGYDDNKISGADEWSDITGLDEETD